MMVRARPSTGSIKPHRCFNKEPGQWRARAPLNRAPPPPRTHGLRSTLRGALRDRERGRGIEEEGEVLCCWIIQLAIQPAAVCGWISAATNVCGAKIAGVGWQRAGGGIQGCRGWGRERKRGRDGSSSLRMHIGKRESRRTAWKMRFTGYSSYRLQIITAKNYINKNTEPKKA